MKSTIKEWENRQGEAMTWEEYYKNFDGWDEGTQAQLLSSLTSLGPAYEICNIIIELQDNVPAANFLLKKAVDAKITFTGMDLVEFTCINDKDLAVAAVRNSAAMLTADDMEDLYGYIDDEVIIDICQQRNIDLPIDLREDDEEPDEDEIEELEPDEDDEDEPDKPLQETSSYDGDSVYERQKKPGLLERLIAVLGVSSSINDDKPKSNNGRCNGY